VAADDEKRPPPDVPEGAGEEKDIASPAKGLLCDAAASAAVGVEKRFRGDAEGVDAAEKKPPEDAEEEAAGAEKRPPEKRPPEVAPVVELPEDAFEKRPPEELPEKTPPEAMLEKKPPDEAEPPKRPWPPVDVPAKRPPAAAPDHGPPVD